jgi:hypothetical protein
MLCNRCIEEDVLVLALPLSNAVILKLCFEILATGIERCITYARG